MVHGHISLRKKDLSSGSSHQLQSLPKPAVEEVAPRGLGLTLTRGLRGWVTTGRWMPLSLQCSHSLLSSLMAREINSSKIADSF